MPEPVPTPTAEEIVTVAEIAMLASAAAAAMIAADEDQGISDAKWARTLEDIDLWPDIRDEAGDIKKVGPIEFFEGTGGMTRLSFRNMIRVRYGQTVLTSETPTTPTVVSNSAVAVSVAADW
jgi:hypothetical protein